MFVVGGDLLEFKIVIQNVLACFTFSLPREKFVDIMLLRSEISFVQK